MSFHVEAGHEVSFSKTVGETDVYMFAGITGDLSPNHVDKVYMVKSSYGRRMAHGALLIGYMSETSTQRRSLMSGTETRRRCRLAMIGCGS